MTKSPPTASVELMVFTCSGVGVEAGMTVLPALGSAVSGAGVSLSAGTSCPERATAAMMTAPMTSTMTAARAMSNIFSFLFMTTFLCEGDT